MKKKSIVLITIIIVVLVISVVAIERNSKTPMERYLEINQSSVQDLLLASKSDESNYIPKEIMNDEGNLKYEFLSCELIDDKDIAIQTKYKGEYFIEGEVPPSDYVVKETDFDAMARDYPKFDEYRNSNCEKGMTESEYKEFMREHEAEYTTDKHVKTKYLFVRCRITYTGNGRSEEYLNNFDVFEMRNNTLLGHNEIDCYFDHPQYTEGDERISCFFLYKFEKAGDSTECVLGCRLREDEFDLSEENKYYIGFQPSVSYSDYDQFNPAIDSRCVALTDMPRRYNHE